MPSIYNYAEGLAGSVSEEREQPRQADGAFGKQKTFGNTANRAADRGWRFPYLRGIAGFRASRADAKLERDES